MSTKNKQGPSEITGTLVSFVSYGWSHSEGRIQNTVDRIQNENLKPYRQNRSRHRTTRRRPPGADYGEAGRGHREDQTGLTGFTGYNFSLKTRIGLEDKRTSKLVLCFSSPARYRCFRSGSPRKGTLLRRASLERTRRTSDRIDPPQVYLPSAGTAGRQA